jgi:hypothetical protein
MTFLLSHGFSTYSRIVVLFECLGLLHSIALHSVMKPSFVNSVGTYPAKSNLALHNSGRDHSNISRISPEVNSSDSFLLGRSGRLLLSFPTAATVFELEAPWAFACIVASIVSEFPMPQMGKSFERRHSSPLQ